MSMATVIASMRASFFEDPLSGLVLDEEVVAYEHQPLTHLVHVTVAARAALPTPFLAPLAPPFSQQRFLLRSLCRFLSGGVFHLYAEGQGKLGRRGEDPRHP